MGAAEAAGSDGAGVEGARKVTGPRDPGTHLPHHVCSRLPAPRADVFVEGDVEVRGRLVVLDHVKQRRGTLRERGKERENGAGG